MYCEKCHSLIEDDETICPICGYDNQTEANVLEETREINLNPKATKYIEDKKKIKKISLLVIILFLIIGICLYIIKDIHHPNNPATQVKEETLELDKEYTLNNLKLSYSSQLFGSSKSTIFYKNNNAYNIFLKEISLEEYNNLQENNFKYEKVLGNISTKFYSHDNIEEYIFSTNNQNYLLTLNYDKSDSEFFETIKKEMLRIVSSLTIS